ncbi:MAG: hypothetical protein K2Y22_14060 [Candidatus Obscuribacterales bacterium]|nr:hypothetical protein [Candidatus Obscuribacterales bacterium]
MTQVFVGQQIQVKFVKHRGSIRAENVKFTKIAFISKRWTSTSHPKSEQPRAREEWICQIIHDTLPDNPRKGVLILAPLRKLTEQIDWQVSEQPKNKEQLLVTKTAHLGERILCTQTFSLSEESAIPPGCPQATVNVIQRKLDEIRYTKLRCSSSISSVDGKHCVVVSLLHQGVGMQSFNLKSESEVNPTWPNKLKEQAKRCLFLINYQEEQAKKRLEQVQARKQKAELAGHRAIEAEAEQRRKLELNFKGGKPVSVVSMTSFKVTSSIEQRILILSNGKTVQVANIAGIFRHGYFVDYVRIDLPCVPILSWEHAFLLTEGSVVSYEYPFQWVNGSLTNGLVGFPKLRPEGAEWRNYPINAIPQDCWELFLAGLEGKFAADILPWHTQVTAEAKEKKKRVIKLTPRQKALQAIVRKQMWKGKEDDYVVIGTNLIFSYETAHGSMLYLVDNPGVGAIYVFTDIQKARQLASNAITRTKAIERGDHRILHNEGWEEKVEALLSGTVSLANRQRSTTKRVASGR